MTRPWTLYRTEHDHPDSRLPQTERAAWADGWNAAVDAYHAELTAALESEPGKVGAHHPETSRRAATMPRFGSQRWQALMALYRRGESTADAVAIHTHRTPNQTATRLLELRELGLVEYVVVDGEYRTWTTRTGQKARLQRLTPAGRAFVQATLEAERAG